MTLFVFAQVATVYSLTGTNHSLIQGEYSNDSFRQRKYVNTAVINNTDSISNLEKNSNQVTEDDAYPDENLGHALFISIADTGITSHVLNTGDNHIILNDVRQFKVSHTCNGNIKGVGRSNVSIWVTGTTYIPIKSDDRTADHIKVTDAVFSPLSPFNFLPPQLFIPALRNSLHKTDYSKHDDVKYIFN